MKAVHEPGSYDNSVNPPTADSSNRNKQNLLCTGTGVCAISTEAIAVIQRQTASNSLLLFAGGGERVSQPQIGKKI